MTSTVFFRERFGTEPTVCGRACGRVNLIGEHTDYNDGFVLPSAIPQVTEAWIAPRPDRRVRAFSETHAACPIDYHLGDELRDGGWGDYVRGVTRILASHGHGFGGFDVYIRSNVPVGSGLSSSAALEVSVLRGLREAYGLPLPDLTIARLAQQVENDFVGARVGIMDPLAASLATWGEALFIDTRDLRFERVPLPMDRMDLLIVHSGVSHANASEGTGRNYNTRRAECEEATQLLGVGSLRELAEADLPRLEPLPDRFRRRARHVITENARVLAAVKALRGGDLERLGELFRASHRSMRDDYDVSTPEVDTLVELANVDPDVYGARLTGGGFGGSIVALTRPDRARVVGEALCVRYRAHCPKAAVVLVPE